MRILLDCYPEAAGIRRGVGRLAIHYACFCEIPSFPIIKMLLSAYPTGAGTADLYGRLPLHYLLDHTARPSAGAVEELLKVFPEGARMKDTSGKYPLTIALERGHGVQVIKLLYNAYPRVVIDAKDPDRSLLHAYVEVIAQPRVDIVRYIIVADSQLADGRPIEEPALAEILRICRVKKLFDVEREILRSFSLEPDRLRELKWIARRDAMLIATSNSAHEGPASTPRFPSSPGGMLRLQMAGGFAAQQVGSTVGKNILKAALHQCKYGFEQIISFL